jgi:D-sedoheptulose 7-phosphate isomerase
MESQTSPDVITPDGLRDIVAEHAVAVTRALSALDLGAVERIARQPIDARARQATVYIAGNGGSAATAAHWVNDLGKATRTHPSGRMRVMSLSDNVPWLTALANDEGYECVFAEQLENFARPGDVLVIISCSGNSPNLLRAQECAAATGMRTLGLLGFDGGALRERVDELLLVPSEPGAYELVEDVHAAVCHMCTRALAASLGAGGA